jgi:hypothetical protein
VISKTLKQRASAQFHKIVGIACISAIPYTGYALVGKPSQQKMVSGFMVEETLSLVCQPKNPPHQQGAERFAKVQLQAPGTIRVHLASFQSPELDITLSYVPQHGGLVRNNSAASATWVNSLGIPAIGVSLVYLGRAWGIVIEFGDGYEANDLAKPGDEYDFLCTEPVTIKASGSLFMRLSMTTPPTCDHPLLAGDKRGIEPISQITCHLTNLIYPASFQ